MLHGEYTVGVEEEYQLVDPESGALQGRAARLVGTRAGALKEDYQQTMLEFATPVCRDAGAVAARLAEGRRGAREAAAGQGLAIAAAGLHPLGAYPAAQISDEVRYWRFAAREGAPARELHIFGTHVHVAVPGREAAVRAMCGAAPHIPPLLALAASSPFHGRRDTGFASFRTLLRDMFPRVAPPFPVASAEEYERLEAILRTPADPAGSSPLAWDIRPSAAYPTLEFRFPDACPWLETVVFLAACVRALTAAFADRPPPRPTGTELQLLRENRWRAARFGLAAHFFRLDPVTGEERDAADALRALVDLLGPVAERLGDGPALERSEAVLARGTAADAMRAEQRRTGSFPAVVRWVVEQTAR